MVNASSFGRGEQLPGEKPVGSPKPSLNGWSRFKESMIERFALKTTGDETVDRASDFLQRF